MSGSYALPERFAKMPRWTSHSDKDPFKVVYSVAHKFSSGVTAIKAAVITCAPRLSHLDERSRWEARPTHAHPNYS